MESIESNKQAVNDCVVAAFKRVIRQPQNIRVINRALLRRNLSDSDYRIAAYQVIGDIISGKELNTVLSSIKTGHIGWNHENFESVARMVDEQDDFIQNPFEVEEGVLQCKCGSKRVFSYAKQCRGADEPMTTFAQCVKCRARWQYSG